MNQKKIVFGVARGEFRAPCAIWTWPDFVDTSRALLSSEREVIMTERTKGPRRAPRTYTREFRQEAVRLMLERRAAGISLKQIGRELEVSPDLLRAWGKDLGVVQPVRDGRPALPAAVSPE